MRDGCVNLKKCLACDSKNIIKILNLGKQPLANNFLNSKNVTEKFYPLAVNACRECTHLQLTHAVSPKLIYQKYLYVSGTTKTYAKYMKKFAKKCISKYGKIKPKTVLDIGCNDGSQLNFFKKNGLKTFGIDPAKNLYTISKKKHFIVCNFFNSESIKAIDQKIDLITSQNSFAHNPNPLSFLKNVKKIMHEKSLFFIQTSQAEMIKNMEFDTVYHEHINFFNIKSMFELTKRAGLELVDVYKEKIFGSSYIFLIKKRKTNINKIKKYIKKERYLSIKLYKKWSLNCKNLIKDLKHQIKTQNKSSFKVIGYGAAAKGNTLINFGNLNLDFIIDDNPLKQKKYSPGKKIPIKNINSLSKISVKKKITFVPLAWNFYKEIRYKIKRKRKAPKDVFIKYFPKVTLSN